MGKFVIDHDTESRMVSPQYDSVCYFKPDRGQDVHYRIRFDQEALDRCEDLIVLISEPVIERKNRYQILKEQKFI
jgi:hypothetical protein